MRTLSYAVICLCAAACVTERGPLANQMSRSGTRYLARAASEPVSWQAWGREAFTLAARLNRPILLFVGSEDCRWCGIMDRETYADPVLGALIDSLFVPVRVDRDQRPDVAQRYETAVELLTGLHGYPLTVFLTPDGSAFFGGTYFPYDDALTGRGMKQILPEVARSFAEQRAFVLRQAALVRQLGYTRTAAAHGVLEARAIGAQIAAVRADLTAAIRSRLSLETGGYAQAAPLLLAAWARSGDTTDLAVARAALDYIADSASIRATDRDEPPDLVRAGMLRNLAAGWASVGDRRYRDVALRLLHELAEGLQSGDDPARFTDRRAFMIGSVLEASAALGDTATARTGLAMLDAMLARAYVKDQGVRHDMGTRIPGTRFLQDQVQVASACLAAYAATHTAPYLEVASDLAAILDRDFADPLGGYFDASASDQAAPVLADRTKELADDLLPGANPWAARVLLQLADATGQAGYRRRAEATLEAFAGIAPAEGIRAATYLSVAQAVLSPRR